MNPTLESSLISATAALAVVLIGQVLVPIVRERLTLKREARYLAIRVVCILDRYVEDCAITAIDAGSVDEDGQYSNGVRAPPAPTWPADVNWKSIDHPLMYKLLALPAAAERAEHYLSSVSDHDTPPYDEYTTTRTRQYSLLGLQANDLAKKLRQAYQIAELPTRVWSPVSHMEERLEAIERSEKESAARWQRILERGPEGPGPAGSAF